MAKVSKKRIELFNNYAKNIIYRCTHQKYDELKSITDNDNEIIGVNSDNLTIICEESTSYNHYYFNVSGNLIILFDDNINCASLVSKYTNQLKRKTLLNNLYSYFSKLVKNVTNSSVQSHEYSFDFSSVEISFSQWHSKKKKEPIDFELKDHNSVIEKDLYYLSCKSLSEYNQIFDVVSKWKNDTLDTNEIVILSDNQVDFKTLQNLEEDNSNLELKSEDNEKIILTDYAKINKRESFKKVVVTFVTIILVCSIVLGVGYGLFTLGKLMVNGISGLINQISFRDENSCYYDNGHLIEESSCTKQGKIKYTCLRHGEEKEVDLPLHHNFLEHCKCVDCGFVLDGELKLDYATKLNYTTDTPYVINHGTNSYISMKYQYGQYIELNHDIVIPQYLSTKDGELYPVKEVNLTYEEPYSWHRKYQNVTIYVPKGHKTNINIGNFAIENLIVFGDVDTLTNYNSKIKTYVKNITVYGNVDNIISNSVKHKKLESLVVTGEIKNFDINFLKNTEIEQINLTKETQVLNNIEVLEELEKLCNLYVPEGNNNFKSIDGVLYSSDMKKLLHYPIGRKANYLVVPDGVENLGNIYTQRNKLKKVIVPASVTSFYKENTTNIVTNLRKVYFKGSEELFNSKFPNGVTIDKTFTKIYYYSEVKIKDGHHWHFNKFNNPKKW